jgi:hypothetical protein
VDEPGSLIFSTRRPGLLAVTSGLALIALLYACASSQPKYIAPTPVTAFSETVKRVAQARGLAPKQDISLAGGASAGKAPELAPLELYNGASLAEVERAYKSIGLLQDSNDFRKELAEARGLERMISYDPAKSTVSWSANMARVSGALAKVDVNKAQDLAPVFAAVQALQEQHFKWRAVVNKVSIEDRRSAFRAIATGDAFLALLSRDMDLDDAKLWPATLEISTAVAAEIDKLAVALPHFLRRQLAFPYRAGSEFVYWALRSRGWQGVNALYANPPLSTAEILHPEKYFIRREPPLRFFPPHLLRRFKKGAAIEQSLGEDAIGGLLASERSAKSAAAGAWRGDQLFAFPEDANLVTVWFSAWGTENQAQEFLRAYRVVLETRHGVRFESPAGQKSAPLIARSRDQRAWLLQSQGPVVLLVAASSATYLLEVAADAWKDLEIENETMDVRFESAHLPHQFSLRSR